MTRSDHPLLRVLPAALGTAVLLLSPALSVAQDRGQLNRIEGEIKKEKGREAALSDLYPLSVPAHIDLDALFGIGVR